VTGCLRCHIGGRVQGVWFRAATREQAQRLGISGYAHNLANGRVEVLACGDKQALASLKAWLWQGPSGAKVTEVECDVIEATPPPGFTTG
jgi:acylphosphatase